MRAKRTAPLKVLLAAEVGEENPPLGAGFLKASADADPRLRGRVSISILEYRELTREVVARVLAAGPDLAGFSCYGDLRAVMKACARLRAASRRMTLAAGGPAVSMAALNEAGGGGFDCAVAGEGEETFVELLLTLLEGGVPEGIAGLSVFKDGAWRHGPRRPLIKDLDSLPSPYLSGIFRPEDYPKAWVQTSRGCPHACTYCVEMGDRSVRRFSEKRVLAEVNKLAGGRPGIRINFTDSDFFLDKQRALRLLRGISELARTGRASFSFCSNLAFWDDELIRSFDQAGFCLNSGVQSADPRVLRLSGRPPGLARLKRNVRRFCRLAPKAKLSLDLMYPLPGDTLAGYRASLDWALTAPAAFMDLHLNHLRIVPESELAAQAAELGIKHSDSFPRLALSAPGFSSGDMAAAEILGDRVLHSMACARHILVRPILLRLAALLKQDTDLPRLLAFEALGAMLQGLKGAADGSMFDGRARGGAGGALARLAVPDLLDRLVARLLRGARRRADREHLSADVARLRAGLAWKAWKELYSGELLTATARLSYGAPPGGTLLVCGKESQDRFLGTPGAEVVLVDSGTAEATALFGGGRVLVETSPRALASTLGALAPQRAARFGRVIISSPDGSVPLPPDVWRALAGLAAYGCRLLLISAEAVRPAPCGGWRLPGGSLKLRSLPAPGPLPRWELFAGTLGAGRAGRRRGIL